MKIEAGKESPYAQHIINKEILLNKYHTYLTQ